MHAESHEQIINCNWPLWLRFLWHISELVHVEAVFAPLVSSISSWVSHGSILLSSSVILWLGQVDKSVLNFESTIVYVIDLRYVSLIELSWLIVIYLSQWFWIHCIYDCISLFFNQPTQVIKQQRFLWLMGAVKSKQHHHISGEIS